MLRYLIPFRMICHKVHNFTSNKLLAVFYIGGNTAQKIKFSIKNFFSKCDQIRRQGFLQYMWPNPQETADLVTFTEKIINGKLHFRCSEMEMALLQLELLNST